MNGKPYTPTEIDMIKQIYPTMKTSCIACIMGRTLSSVYQIADRNNIKKDPEFLAQMNKDLILKVGANTRFKKGSVPPNKGKKQSEYMSPEAIEKTKATRFKPGMVPANTKYDGHERMDREGYVYIRISKGKYVLKHQYLWEQKNGPVPPKHILVFKDGIKTNTDPDNLELITMRENLRRNSIHRFPEELKEIIHLKNKLKRKIKNIQNYEQ